MATQALLEAPLVHVEESQAEVATTPVPSPSTPEATPPREPSRPVKPVKSLSRHELEPDLMIRPFPKLPDKIPEPTPKSPGSDTASVRYDSEEGKLKPCGFNRRVDPGAVTPHSLAIDFELAAQKESEPEEPEEPVPAQAKVLIMLYTCIVPVIIPCSCMAWPCRGKLVVGSFRIHLKKCCTSLAGAGVDPSAAVWCCFEEEEGVPRGPCIRG